jgi:sialic acid synthase SpsE/mannose-6-phosphate isomerase-like protein (cupin superfamily)
MLIIFEIANNHNGSLELGKRIVDELAVAVKEFELPDIHFAIKLQARNLDTFIHPSKVLSWEDTPHLKRFIETKLSINEYTELCNYIKDSGFILGVTPFDEESVELVESLDVQFIKVASCSANDWSLMDRITKGNKPLIISTGGLNWDQIDNVYNYLRHKEKYFSFLHCVGVYPVPQYLLNLNVIDKMKKRYDTDIGFSDHSMVSDQAVRVAVAKGASIIERHVGLENLNLYSMHAGLDIPVYIQAIKDTLQICGKDNKEISELEKENLRQLKRGVYAKKDIELNTSIVKDDVFFAFPNIKGQLVVDEFSEYRSEFMAGTNYKKDEPILDHDSSESKIKLIRTHFHRAKSILAELGIYADSKHNAELSHHYGKERFEEYGGVIFDLINREYCEKIIVLFPNQKYPMHSHHSKEETFRVLKGVLHIIIEGKEYEVMPGQTILVDRYAKHNFWAGKQALVFEEISTTNVKGDSYYEDTEIYKLDPMERKTSIEKI